MTHSSVKHSVGLAHTEHVNFGAIVRGWRQLCAPRSARVYPLAPALPCNEERLSHSAHNSSVVRQPWQSFARKECSVRS